MFDNNAMSKLLEGKTSLWLPILSGSMAPFLLPGDELFIEPLKENIQTGDIAVFWAGGKFFSHRIIFVFSWGKRRFVLEKGDANHHANFVKSSKILGTVTRFRRENRIQDLTSSESKKQARKLSRKSLLHFITYPYNNLIKRIRRRLKL